MEEAILELEEEEEDGERGIYMELSDESFCVCVCCVGFLGCCWGFSFSLLWVEYIYIIYIGDHI